MVKRVLYSLVFLAASAGAQQITPVPPPPNITISDPSSLTTLYEQMVGRWFNAVGPYATEIFWALAALDIAWFGISLAMQYGWDISRAMMAVTNKLIVLGMFLALLLNGNVWMTAIINSFITIGKDASGVQSLAPSNVFAMGFQIFGSILWQAVKTGFMFDIPTAGALIVGAFFIFVSFLILTILFVVAKVNVFLALGIGFLFLGFGGSKWTAPYVERYFAFAVTSGIKLMAIYLLVGAGWQMAQNWVTQAQQAALTPASVELTWAIMGGALLYAFICWFCTQLISSVLGGSPTLSHGDFIHFMSPMMSAGIAGAMVGAGLATGGAGAVAGASAAGAAAGAKGANAATSGASAGASSPPSSNGSGGGKSVGSALGSAAMAGVGAAGRMPHGGHVGSAPKFGGFSHE